MQTNIVKIRPGIDYKFVQSIKQSAQAKSSSRFQFNQRWNPKPASRANCCFAGNSWQDEDLFHNTPLGTAGRQHDVASTSAISSLPHSQASRDSESYHHEQAPARLTRSFTSFDDDERPSSARKAPPASLKTLRYKTIMLKVSGEALQGTLGFGVDAVVMRSVAEEVQELVEAGVKVAIVVGGGNYFRGANAWQGLERATADYVGMLATVMNALQLQGALEGLGVDTRVQTAIEMREVAEAYIRRRAVAHLNAGRVVIFGAGTGNPFFTTDTAAALRAAEINAEVFIKATKVDGIYDSDPAKNPLAKKYARLSYRQCTDDSLRVMDETAITLCKENNIPVLVLNMLERGTIMRAVLGESVGTVVCENCEEADDALSLP